MERFCGYIQRAVRSRHYPWGEIDNYVMHRAQLRIISLRYNLGDHLNFSRRRTAEHTRYHTYTDCKFKILYHFLDLPHATRHVDPDISFLQPKKTNAVLSHEERLQIGKHLSTRWSVSASPASEDHPALNRFDAKRETVLKYLPLHATQWGKMRIGNDGDMIHAHRIVNRANDGRDATYVRVSRLSFPLLRILDPFYLNYLDLTITV